MSNENTIRARPEHAVSLVVAMAVAAGAACTPNSAERDWSFDDRNADSPRADTRTDEETDGSTSDAYAPDTGGADDPGADVGPPCDPDDPTRIRHATLAHPLYVAHPYVGFAPTRRGLFYTIEDPEPSSESRRQALAFAPRTSDREVQLTRGGASEHIVHAAEGRALAIRRAPNDGDADWSAITVDTDGSVRTISDLRKSRKPSKFRVRDFDFDGNRAIFAMQTNGENGEIGIHFDYFDGETVHSTNYDLEEHSAYPPKAELVDGGFVARIAEASADGPDRLVQWSPDDGWTKIAEYTERSNIRELTASGNHVFWTNARTVSHHDLRTSRTDELDALESRCNLSETDGGRVLLGCIGRISDSEIRSAVHVWAGDDLRTITSSTSQFVANTSLSGDRAAWFEYPQQQRTDTEHPQGRVVTYDLATGDRRQISEVFVPSCAPHYACPATRNGSAGAFRAPQRWRLSFHDDVVAWNFADLERQDSDLRPAQTLGWKALGTDCR